MGTGNSCQKEYIQNGVRNSKKIPVTYSMGKNARIREPTHMSETKEEAE